MQDIVNAVIPSGMSARGRLTAPNGRHAVHKRFDNMVGRKVYNDVYSVSVLYGLKTLFRILCGSI
jgi:hypothetical protein